MLRNQLKNKKWKPNPGSVEEEEAEAAHEQIDRENRENVTISN